MKPVRFSEEKNKWLKEKRGFGFEDIIQAIETECPVEVVNHPNKNKYKNQKIFLIFIENYIFSVPFVEEKEYIFFKTVYPSRKYTKKYLAKLKVEK